MGMFDYVRVELELPNRPPWASSFQTKSRHRELATIVLKANGEVWEIDNLGDGEPYPAMWTGELRFYDIPPDPNRRGWVEYLAQVERGKVVRVEQVKYEESDQ